MENKQTSRHERIKHEIAASCLEAGFLVKEECSGTDWRADVLTTDGQKSFALEVQITKQSLRRTLERQMKYLRDGVLGCWLFETEPSRSKPERVDLPLFKIESKSNQVYVSLKGGKSLPIRDFVHDFLRSRIQFRHTVRTTSVQRVELSFASMKCWKCGAPNHTYFANQGYYSSCNTALRGNEMLWYSSMKEYRPEVIDYVRKYVQDHPEKGLLIGSIERRFSKTVGASYTSFGCHSCNSIFGDWFVEEARIESLNGDGIVDKTVAELSMDVELSVEIPHWCHPGDGDFC